MSRTPAAACCVEPRSPGRLRPSGQETVVIVVIMVLASALTVAGLPPSALLAVLGTAALVSLGTLLSLRGCAPAGRVLIRGLRTAAA